MRQAAILLAGLVAACALAAPASAARPNIVLVLTDDQRWDTLWAMPAVRSLLVRQGVTFTNSFVTTPVCCPSRVSTLTGRYPHSTGVYRNVPPHGGFASFRDGQTIAVRLAAAGYRTAYVGKYLNGYEGQLVRYVPPGWDRWVALAPLGFYRYGLSVDGAVDPPGTRHVHSTDRLTAEALAFVRTTRSPFFLVYAPYAPHPPAIPARRHEHLYRNLAPWRPPSYNERDVSDKPSWLRRTRRLGPAERQRLDRLRAAQLRSLRSVDDGVARIVAALRETGRLRDTIVVFTSDNGFSWGEHRWGNKHVAYEESIRVPLVVRYDRVVASRRTDARLVLNIDLAPTFAQLARTRLPGAAGRSLVPLLRHPSAPGRTAFAIERLARPGYRPPTYCGVRDERYSYVVYRSGKDELYDLAADPYQLASRARDPALAATRDRLRATLGSLCNPTPPGFPPRRLCVAGTPGGDVFTGSAGTDVFCAGTGSDTVLGKGGADHLFLGPGDDWAAGGNGSDQLDGGRGRDILLGEGGDDVVLSRDGERDTVDCGPGRDRAVADRRDRVDPSCERVSRR